METNTQAICSCSRPLPSSGYFCGGCLNQFKCKSCQSLLEKDAIGCTNCGTPKEEKIIPKEQQSTNTFRLHETATDRTIEATFSDTVGKDLAGILRDTSANRMKAIGSSSSFSQAINTDYLPETGNFVDTEIINTENNKESINASVNSANLHAASKLNEYPVLKAVAMKNLPKSETEWIVVYAFYASNFGIDTFSRQDILKRYEESNRLDSNKKSALSMYITRAVQGEYINPLSSDYSILQKGIDKAKEIITRTSSSSPKTKSIGKKKEDVVEEIKTDKVKKSRIGGKNYKRLTDLNFYPTGKDSLDVFMKKFSIKNDNERNLLFVNYLAETLKIPNIGVDHIYTCYDEAGGKIPENLVTSLSNTKGRTGWIESNGSGITITTKGKNKIRLWDKKD